MTTYTVELEIVAPSCAGPVRYTVNAENGEDAVAAARVLALRDHLPACDALATVWLVTP